ncbi:MAG: HAD-IA family hydrolase [Flavobacterium sp.]
MINTIIFDFGDVFINLNKAALQQALLDLGIKSWSEKLKQLNHSFEIGKINQQEFLEGLAKEADVKDPILIKKAWNTILGDFPENRLAFLKGLKGKYKLILLSNTDEIHIQHFKENYGETFVRDFFECFDTIYFSFEMGLRKPDIAIYERVIQEQNFTPEKTLFVDDRKENTDVAQLTHLKTRNLIVGQEDVIHLLSHKNFQL